MEKKTSEDKEEEEKNSETKDQNSKEGENSNDDNAGEGKQQGENIFPETQSKNLATEIILSSRKMSKRLMTTNKERLLQNGGVYVEGLVE